MAFVFKYETVIDNRDELKKEIQDLAQEIKGVVTSVLLIGIMKVLADIPYGSSPQKGVGDGVTQGIPIGMTQAAPVEWDGNPTHHKRSVRDQAMNIVTCSGPDHLNLSLFSWRDASITIECSRMQSNVSRGL